MFEILRKSFSTGVVTSAYPKAPPQISSQVRGRPGIDFANWKDARPAVAACPTGALSFSDNHTARSVTLDLGNCTFCGLCAEADPAIRMTNICELAAASRADLTSTARYELASNGSHQKLLPPQPSTLGPTRNTQRGTRNTPLDTRHPALESLGSELKSRIHSVLGRSLHIREVDAASCNGCEIEIGGLNSPIYDVERFGIHFVASPRHADMLLVTGPVSRNMELALRKTYDATPEPRLVVAVGACACGGGIFGQNYASLGGVDKVVPVDVFIPGCPPNPHALLHGILTAVGRLQS